MHFSISTQGMTPTPIDFHVFDSLSPRRNLAPFCGIVDRYSRRKLNICHVEPILFWCFWLIGSFPVVSQVIYILDIYVWIISHDFGPIMSMILITLDHNKCTQWLAETDSFRSIYTLCTFIAHDYRKYQLIVNNKCTQRSKISGDWVDIPLGTSTVRGTCWWTRYQLGRRPFFAPGFVVNKCQTGIKKTRKIPQTSRSISCKWRLLNRNSSIFIGFSVVNHPCVGTSMTMEHNNVESSLESRGVHECSIG